ncbi:uncharacterized protein LOC8032304 [Ixodes scapularis]|uniref:uncharacterized protein LOC8032304 n=1 Tax=Ixodes scapularis TaxID=6945 RepID=UPI001C392EAD|nr:uncharacterized protein LOC8032304 [Ixodes scapularis]
MAYWRWALLPLCLCVAGLAGSNRQNRRQLLEAIRRGGSGVFHVTDAEMRMSLASTLVHDSARANARGAILVLVPSEVVAQQYADYFKGTSPLLVGTSLDSLSSLSLRNRNVTLTTASALSHALHVHDLELGELVLVIADDASDLTRNQFSEPALRVPASGSRSSPRVVAFSRARDTSLRQQGIAMAQHLLGLDPAAKGLPFPRRLVVDALSSYAFKDQDLLIRALLHPAKARQLGSSISYEPLDFIGHFALHFVLARHMVRNGTRKEKASMHNLMTEALRQEACAFLAAKNHLDLYVFLDDGQEKRAMTEYATAARAQDYAGRSSLANQKSFLHNIFKSVAGAVYVDSGYDPDVLERIYLRLFTPYLDALPTTF